jgi:hypothetical protein
MARVISAGPGVELLAQNRRLVAVGGLCALLSLGILGESTRGEALATAALALLAAATMFGCWELARSRDRSASRTSGTQHFVVRYRWRWIIAAVAVTATAIAQTWFRTGYSIAYGDIFPPDGIAGIGRLFSSWSWSGSDLGGAAADERQLLAAPFFLAAHILGGGAPLGQRFLYTVLFVGVGFSAVALLWALGLSRFGALVGATYYLLNAFLLSGGVPTYTALATLVVVPLLPALALAAGAGRMSLRGAVVAEAITAPLVGFVYLNPPSAGMAIAAFIATPLLAAWIFGRAAMRRSAVAVLLGLAGILLLSAYWIVPSIIQFGNVGTAQLSSPSSWIWTENRATIFNALWLNTNWGWSFTYYFPYAGQYQGLLLSLAKFAPACLAFGALVLIGGAEARRGRENLKIACAFTAVALPLIFLSTGTNLPGALLFNPLYSLPYGWLLREPGRFLLLASLAYAVLIAVSAEVIRNSTISRKLAGLRGATTELQMTILKAIPSLALTAVALVPGYPIATGAFVPDHGLISPAHVRLPPYWPTMANEVDSTPAAGPLIVLPPDDFYQMPYKWGFYGSDNFISNLMQRPVIVPKPGLGAGYTSTSAEVLQTHRGVADALLADDWSLAERLMQALGSNLVLVRGDVDAGSPGRSIVSPERLSASLDRAPNFIRIKTEGPLALFQLKSPAVPEQEISPSFVTVNTDKPDLRILRYLPRGTHLVSGLAMAAETSISFVPPLAEWQLSRNKLVYGTTVSPGRDIRLVELEGGTQTSQYGLTETPSPNGLTAVHLQVAVSENRISNGDFHQGSWGATEDCNAQSPAAPATFVADVLPSDGPSGQAALKLSAKQDSACQSRAIDWQGRPLILEMWVRHVEGAGPRLCVWEFGSRQCAVTPPLPISNSWTRYRAAVSPDPGTTSLRLFLYADGGPGRTTNLYAAASAVEIPSLGQPAIMATGLSAETSSYLLTYHTSYSAAWDGSPGGTHVLVDGLVNGWIVNREVGRFAVQYRPLALITSSFVISALVLVLLLTVLFVPFGRLRGILANRLGDASSGSHSPLQPSSESPEIHGSRDPVPRDNDVGGQLG